MKLNQIKPIRNKRIPSMVLTIDGDMDDKTHYELFEVEATYEYEPDSHSDHPYGDGTAREYHTGSLGFIDLKLKTAAREVDPDTEKLIKEWPIGTDVTKMPGWSEELRKHFEDNDLRNHIINMED